MAEGCLTKLNVVGRTLRAIGEATGHALGLKESRRTESDVHIGEGLGDDV